MSSQAARVLPKALDCPGTGLYPARAGAGRHKAVMAVRPKAVPRLMILFMVLFIIIPRLFCCCGLGHLLLERSGGVAVQEADRAGAVQVERAVVVHVRAKSASRSAG